MKTTCLLTMAAGLACCALAHAEPPKPELSTGEIKEAVPTAVARVKMVNGKPVLDGPWMPYTGFTPRSAMIDAVFFDCYGRHPATSGLGSAPGTFCPITCPPPGTISTGVPLWFPAGTVMPNIVEDMEDLQCPPASVVDEIDFMWSQEGPGPIYMVFFMYEDMLDGTCLDPAGFTSTGSGVALAFGAIPAGEWWAATPGLASLGLTTPSAASGSYQWIMASSVTSTGITLFGGGSSPALWGTGDATGELWRPGRQNEVMYSDDNPTDGTFDPLLECYSRAYGLCPDPLGAAVAFCYLRCPADFNNDGFVNQLDNDQFLTAWSNGDMAADVNGSCSVNLADLIWFVNEWENSCGCPTSGSGSFSLSYKITGLSSDVGWSWSIPEFPAEVNYVHGIPLYQGPRELAQAFADSINDYSISHCGDTRLLAEVNCDGCWNTQSPAVLRITVSGMNSFSLWVGDYGDPASMHVACTPTCYFNPRMDLIPPSGTDCNGNGWDDAVDITLGTSFDSNLNGIPDECESFCPADYNHDGFVDGIDYDQFNNDFENPDPAQQIRADYNGDGFVDGIDYDQFMNDFEVGC